MFKYQRHGRRVWSTKVGLGLTKAVSIYGASKTQGSLSSDTHLRGWAKALSLLLFFCTPLHPAGVILSRSNITFHKVSSIHILSFIWPPLPLSLPSGCRRELPGPEMRLLSQEVSCEAPGLGCLSMCLHYPCLKWQSSPIHRSCYVRLPRWLPLCQSFGLL